MAYNMLIVLIFAAVHCEAYQEKELCPENLPAMKPIVETNALYYIVAVTNGLATCGNITLDSRSMTIVMAKQFHYPHKDYHEFLTEKFSYSERNNTFVGSTRPRQVYLHESWIFVYQCTYYPGRSSFLGSKSRVLDKSLTLAALNYFVEYINLFNFTTVEDFGLADSTCEYKKSSSSADSQNHWIHEGEEPTVVETQKMAEEDQEYFWYGCGVIVVLLLCFAVKEIINLVNNRIGVSR